MLQVAREDCDFVAASLGSRICGVVLVYIGMGLNDGFLEGPQHWPPHTSSQCSSKLPRLLRLLDGGQSSKSKHLDRLLLLECVGLQVDRITCACFKFGGGGG